MALELALTVGEEVNIDLRDETGLQVNWELTGSLPPGLEFVPAFQNARIEGTPTEAGTFTGSYVSGESSYGDWEVRDLEFTVTAESEDPDPGDGEDPDPGDGEDPDPGDDDEEDPGPEPDPLDPFELFGPLARALAPRVAAFVGRPDDEETTANAEAQIPIVTEYVRGFTRGRGFRDEAPAGPLRAVIVSGVARLATNPEQVTVFTTGDYSERPAQLAGWTLTELGVLRRFRRVTA